MSNSYDYPTDQPVVGQDGRITAAWGQWVQRTHNNARTLQQSGPTAERPTKLLWIGRFYYDTDLGMPIWLHAINPIVWHDAAGNPV